MKHLTISALSLLSDIERKARSVQFEKKDDHPRRNQTGKSSLVKSLYHALGAEPAKQHSRWESANVRSLIKFAVDDQEFLMIRQEGMFLLFTGSGRFLQSFSSITKDLGPTIAQIFDFRARPCRA